MNEGPGCGWVVAAFLLILVMLGQESSAGQILIDDSSELAGTAATQASAIDRDDRRRF